MHSAASLRKKGKILSLPLHAHSMIWGEGIFCLYGAFLENSLSKQNVPSPHMLAVCMQGEEESLSFFF